MPQPQYGKPVIDFATWAAQMIEAVERGLADRSLCARLDAAFGATDPTLESLLRPDAP